MLDREDTCGATQPLKSLAEVFSPFISDSIGNFKAAAIVEVLTQALAGGRPALIQFGQVFLDFHQL